MLRLLLAHNLACRKQRKREEQTDVEDRRQQEQPGEEGPGGAEPMIEEGLLDVAGRRVDACIRAARLLRRRPFGQWASRPGRTGAAADEVKVRVHRARAVTGRRRTGRRTRSRSPARWCSRCRRWSRGGFDVFDPVVVTVGRIAGGTKENIIPDEAEFEATVRSLSAAARAKIQADITRAGRGHRRGARRRGRGHYKLGYPVTVNDDTEYARAKQAVDDLFGADRYTELPNPELGSEDMAFVMELVPGAYFNVGACPVDGLRRTSPTTTRRARRSTTRSCPTARPGSPRWPYAG